MIGRVTSTYYSPTLGRGIAMGLVAHGPERMGEVHRLSQDRRHRHRGEGPDRRPGLLRPGGEKQNV
jgi:sarcosine oxidase subunit alpha